MLHASQGSIFCLFPSPHKGGKKSKYKPQGREIKRKSEGKEKSERRKGKEKKGEKKKKGKKIQETQNFFPVTS